MKKKGIGTGELVTLLLAVLVMAILLILVVTNLDIFKKTTRESSVKTWVAEKANTGIQTSNLPSRPPTPTLLDSLYLIKEDLKAKQGERTSKANKEIADAMIQCASSFGQQDPNAKIPSFQEENIFCYPCLQIEFEKDTVNTGYTLAGLRLFMSQTTAPLSQKTYQQYIEEFFPGNFQSLLPEADALLITEKNYYIYYIETNKQWYESLLRRLYEQGEETVTTGEFDVLTNALLGVVEIQEAWNRYQFEKEQKTSKIQRIIFKSKQDIMRLCNTGELEGIL